jgi:hypothetical protein
MAGLRNPRSRASFARSGLRHSSIRTSRSRRQIVETDRPRRFWRRVPPDRFHRRTPTTGISERVVSGEADLVEGQLRIGGMDRLDRIAVGEHVGDIMNRHARSGEDRLAAQNARSRATIAFAFLSRLRPIFTPAATGFRSTLSGSATTTASPTPPRWR